MPQLIDTDDIVIAYSDVESEHVIGPFTDCFSLFPSFAVLIVGADALASPLTSKVPLHLEDALVLVVDTFGDRVSNVMVCVYGRHCFRG